MLQASSLAEARNQAWSWRAFASLTAIGALLLAYFAHLGSNRLIAQDEGFYVMAAKLVAAGRAPYLDFFYPQMPLAPYLLGGWLALTESSWRAARMLPAIFNAATGLLIYRHIRVRLGGLLAAAGTLMFATSSLVISTCGTTKTYTFSLLPLLGACVLLADADRIGRMRIAAAGLLFALAINVRAPLAIALPAFLAHLCLAKRSDVRVTERLAAFLGGFAIGCLPAGLFALADFEAFWFNNLGYHMDRAGTGESAARAADSRLGVAEKVFGIASDGRLDLLPFPILVYASAAIAIACIRSRRPIDPSISVGLLLLAGNFLPAPTYYQYFVTCEVLLSLGVLVCAGAMPRGTDTGRKRALVCAAAAVVALRLVSTPAVIERYSDTGHRVIGISKKTVESWRVTTVERVGRELDSLNRSGGPIMALWPGHLLSSSALPMPGLENHFAVRFVSKNRPNEEEIRRFHLISWRQIMQSVKERVPELVVFLLLDKPSFKSALEENGYRLVSKIESVSIYRRENGGDGSAS